MLQSDWKNTVLDVLKHISVIWHGEFRRWYTLHKSCDLAFKKRTPGILSETQENDKQDDVFVVAPEDLTRSQGSTFDNVTFVKSHSQSASTANDSKSWTVVKTKSRGILNDAHMLDICSPWCGCRSNCN